MHEDIHHISMGPYKPMRPVTETWPMLFFPIHMTNLHVGSTDYYDNVCYMGSHQITHLAITTTTHHPGGC